MTGRKFVMVIGFLFAIALLVYIITTPRGSAIALTGIVDGAHQLIVKRPQVAADDPSEIAARFHGLALNQAGIVGMSGQEVEIAGHESAQAFGGRTVLVGGWNRLIVELAEKIFQNGAMQTALVAEIIIKHGLIGVSRGGNLLGARPGHPFGREVALGGSQDPARGGGVLSFAAPAFHRV